MDYSGLLDFSPLAQFAIDSGHRIVGWNRACEAMTGFRAKDMIGTGLRSIAPDTALLLPRFFSG